MEKSDLVQFELPDQPGIYRFLKGSKLLYVGKATSLKDRVRSYFSKDLANTRGQRIEAMVQEATRITWEPTDSVLEALILEANLIKKHQPPYNAREKDNKSYNYLVITREAFPRVLVVRGRELFQNWQEKDIKKLFGPFPEGGALKIALKLVRKIFPFRDACAPAVPGKSAKPCFNRQLGLCPGVCDGTCSATQYARIVQHITLLFSGKKGTLLRSLEKDMHTASAREAFEDAAQLQKQVYALTHIRDVALIKRDFHSSGGESGLVRLEAYDIAHLAGNATVGVMTVVENGEVNPAAYRKFNIRTVHNDDTKALCEILERRFGHPEWTMPELIVIDGGKGQLSAANRVLRKLSISIPVVSVLKDEHHKARDILGDSPKKKIYEREILLANAESHRFAIGFHRKKLRRSLLQ
ncbi:MAG: GIY-YIG nuclease family protein [Candidatus Pacebacteria bacterium]|nr:GIY-YIG nuclease family protein [Candidatus Paceibacterota bacterium]